MKLIENLKFRVGSEFTIKNMVDTYGEFSEL